MQAFQTTKILQQYGRLSPTLLRSNREDNEYNPTRRDVLFQSASLALAGLLTGGSPVQAASETPKTIVMTGANSGIGFKSCKKLAAQGHSIVLACRSLSKAEDAIQRIRETGVTTGNLTPAACDLTSLESIKSFADSLSISTIDALCLNAGIARSTGATDCARTVDGFELTGTCIIPLIEALPFHKSTIFLSLLDLWHSWNQSFWTLLLELASPTQGRQ